MAEASDSSYDLHTRAGRLIFVFELVRQRTRAESWAEVTDRVGVLRLYDFIDGKDQELGHLLGALKKTGAPPNELEPLLVGVEERLSAGIALEAAIDKSIAMFPKHKVNMKRMFGTHDQVGAHDSQPARLDASVQAGSLDFPDQQLSVPKTLTKLTLREQRKVTKGGVAMSAIVGLILFALGVAITAGTYAVASRSGGFFLVTYGLIFCGLGLILKAIWRALGGSHS